MTSNRPLHTLGKGPDAPPRRAAGRGVALLVTEGFEDLLFINDAQPEIGSILGGLQLGDLLAREHCIGVPERLSADGSVLRALTKEALIALQERVKELGVSAVAVVLLHSYQNAAHEEAVAQALAPLGLPVSLSSVVARIPNERVRAQATFLDAYLAVPHSEELLALHTAGLSRILCVDSAGNVGPASQILPLRRILSHAAAGLRGAERIASAHGLPRFLALGMSSDRRFATLALCQKAIESDAAPQLKLGMDARLQREMGDALDLELPALELRIIRADASDAAQADALAEQILAAFSAMTLDRGYDPESFPLLCYGRIEQTLGKTIGKRLGSASTLLLPAPELVVAYGALCAPLVYERREILCVEASSAQQTGQVAATLQVLTTRLGADLKRDGYLVSHHLPGHEWLAEMRYQGQGMGCTHALALPGLGDGSPAASGDTDLVVRFYTEHQRRFGYTLAECPVELLALRVRLTLPVATPAYAEFAKLAAHAL